MMKLLPRTTYTIENGGTVIELDGVKLLRVTRSIGGEDYTDYEPADPVPSGYLGWMYDGTKVMITTDPYAGLYHVRDRAETTQEYEMLSR